MKVCQNQENEHIKTKEINMTNTGHEIITQGTITPNYMEYEKMLATENVDHIRINSKSTTSLGVMLEARYVSAFYHPKYGMFATLSGFWNFISFEQPEEAFRVVTGKDIHEQVARCRANGNKQVKFADNADFRRLIKEAVIYKILGNSKIFEQLSESVLPFRLYYYKNQQDEFVDKSAKEKWLFDIYEDVRKLAQGKITIQQLLH